MGGDIDKVRGDFIDLGIYGRVFIGLSKYLTSQMRFYHYPVIPNFLHLL